MNTPARSKGAWTHRFAIRGFTLLLGILVFWLLGFLVADIAAVPGPLYADIERQRVDQRLVADRASLEQQIAELTRQIDNQTEQQRVVGDSSRNLQQTIGQLTELQRLGLQKGVALSSTEQANLASSLGLFLDNQRKYQDLGQAVAAMTDRRQTLIAARDRIEQALEQQRGPAREEYDARTSRHRLKLALWQLALLLPILAVAGVLVQRQRGHLYFPLFLAFGVATLAKVALVIHEYFPSRYVKYVLIGALIFVVVRLLTYFIRLVASPPAQSLVNQYRDAYERFLCPVCEYPIRTGPRRFLFWTRRSARKLTVAAGAGEREEPYVCPCCGTALFVTCESCHGVRHALLPNCSHCGAARG